MRECDPFCDMIHLVFSHKMACIGLVFVLCFSSGTFADNSRPGENTSHDDVPSPLKGKKICIDPGHGGDDTGAQSPDGLQGT